MFNRFFVIIIILKAVQAQQPALDAKFCARTAGWAVVFKKNQCVFNCNKGRAEILCAGKDSVKPTRN